MNFDKKYWSVNEYTKNNNDFSGFVGISDNKVYDYLTKLPLESKNMYLERINNSKDNFDRILLQDLKLPYEKKDILFSANDFVHANTLEIIINRLHANNDYIFKNSIISNSSLPVASNYISLVPDADGLKSQYLNKDKKNVFEPNYNFYPNTKTFNSYFAKTKFNKDTETISSEILFKEPDKPKKSYPEDDEEDRGLEGKDLWLKINRLETINDDTDFIIAGDLPTETEPIPENYNNIIIYNNIIGKINFLSHESDNEIFTVGTPAISNLLNDLTDSSSYIRINSISFISENEISNDIILSIDEEESSSKDSINIKNNYFLNKYFFAKDITEDNITDKNEITFTLNFKGVLDNAKIAYDENNKIRIIVEFELISDEDDYITKIKDYYYISDIIRSCSYGFYWSDERWRAKKGKT